MNSHQERLDHSKSIVAETKARIRHDARDREATSELLDAAAQCLATSQDRTAGIASGSDKDPFSWFKPDAE